MLIRPLVRSDIPRVLEISIQVFSGDELFRWLYPYQDRYPNDLRRFQLIRLRGRVVQQGGQAFVAVTEPGDEFYTGKPQIIGFGFFIRKGSDEAARIWKAESWFNKLERHLLSWDAWYEMKFLQRALDRKAEAMFAGASSRYDFYKALEDYWLLGLLGVDPKHQRKGVGQKITRRLLSIASEEKVPVVLQASVTGRMLYRKMGFKEIERPKLLGDVNGSEGGVAMLKEPTGMEGKWLLEQEDGSAKLITV